MISGKKREVYVPNGINLNRRTAYYGGITVVGESWQEKDCSSLFGSATVSRVRLEDAAEAVDPLYKALEAEGFRREGVYVRDVREKASLEQRTC